MSSTMKEPALEGETQRAGPVPVPTALASGRGYVVLQMVADEENRWADLGSYAATSTEDAIKQAAAVQAADPDVDTTGVLTYVAVPARSFQPVELTARVEPKIEFRSKP